MLILIRNFFYHFYREADLSKAKAKGELATSEKTKYDTKIQKLSMDIKDTEVSTKFEEELLFIVEKLN